ncbi:hypothetical protein PIB30_031361 [Stylosanthes scabra]|uniref:Uncharacterized protein n=1 Tax=Stylosanthes scabra TaxID=79078 RepID=A0ABU6V9X1_9FABA|nr:hypothetical protein [Stylosanthes scabra]
MSPTSRRHQPQNQQNQRCQPLHLRQNLPQSSYDDTLRAYQQESRKLREVHKRTKARLTDLTELLDKFTSQIAVNPQPLQPSVPSPLPSQPLRNPNAGINMVQANNEKCEEDERKKRMMRKKKGIKTTIDYMNYWLNWLEKVLTARRTITVEVSDPDKEDDFVIATVYGGNEGKPEELPEKCADPGPCFVTCKIGRGNKGSNSQVLLGKPFLKTPSLKLNYYDETFSFEVGNVSDISADETTHTKGGGVHPLKEAGKEKAAKETSQMKSMDKASIPKHEKEKKPPTVT